MKKALWLASTMIVAASMVGAPVYAGGKTKEDTRDQEIQELRARLDRLEREQEDEKVAAQHQNQRVNELTDRANDVQWSFDNGRPTIKSGDGRFQMSIRGRFHADFVNFFQDPSDFGPATPAALRDLSSGAVFRRAQFGVEGKVFKDFDYEMRFNFGGSDAEQGDPFVNIMRVAYTGIANFRINVGVIQPIFTMEDSVSSNDVTFMERPGIVATVTGNFGGDDARRGVEMTFQKVGFLMSGDNLVLSGAFTGARTGSAHTGTSDEQTQVLGRVAYRVFSDSDTNIQIGADAGRVNSLTGVAAGTAQTLQLRERPEERVDGTRLIDTGSIPITTATMYGFEAGANFKNFYLAGEYYHMSEQRDLLCPVGCPGVAVLPVGYLTGDPEFSGWYVAGSWILTGEKKNYAAGSGSNNMAIWAAPRVALPFSLDGDAWGAWELAGRYSEENLNWNENTPVNLGGIRGGEQKIWTVGMNWYLNNNIRWIFDFSHVDVDRFTNTNLAPTPANQQGQTFDWLGTRVQFAF